MLNLNKLILSAIIIILLHGKAHSIEFACEGLQDTKTFVKLEEPLIYGDPSVYIKRIIDKNWNEARLVDHGENWFSFIDGWGYYGEESINGTYSQCKLYDVECGSMLKVIEYSDYGDVSVHGYARKNCCVNGSDYKLGDEFIYFPNCTLLSK